MLSVDTSDPEVMRAVIDEGVDLINDVRALTMPGALRVVAQSKVTVCLMAMSDPEQKGLSHTLEFSVLLREIKDFLSLRIQACENEGMGRERLWIDPGFGGGMFGKSRRQNLQLIGHLASFESFGLPMVAGISRKQFIGEILQKPPEDRLYGTLTLTAILVLNGAKVIRTHDVLATVEGLATLQAFMEETKNAT